MEKITSNSGRLLHLTERKEKKETFYMYQGAF